MDVKKELTNYNTYKAKITMLEKRKIELYEIHMTLSAVSYDGIPAKTTFQESRIEKQAVKIADERQDIENEIKKHQVKIEVLDSLIRILDDNKRTVIIERFINGRKIVDIAVEMKKDVTTIAKAIEKSINMLNSIEIPSKFYLTK